MNILKMYTDLIRYQFYFSFDFILVFIRCFLPIASCKKLKTEQTNRYYFNVYLILFFYDYDLSLWKVKHDFTTNIINN